MYLQAPDGWLHLTFIDVGHGDAILIQTPSGRYALIDGDPSPNTLVQALGRTLPVTARTIDLVLAASPKTDSLGGLPGLLGRYDIRQVLMAGDTPNSSAYREWIEGLTARKIKTDPAEMGQWFDLGDGAVLEVVEVNSSGATLRLSNGNAAFLLPLGLNTHSSTGLAEAGRIAPAIIMLLPAHGGEESISEAFIDAIQPLGVVVAVGVGNAKGDPQPETLAMLEGTTLLRTDPLGTIRFATDEVQLWVEAER